MAIVGTIQRGRRGEGDYISNVQNTAGDFQTTKDRGRSILVAPSSDGPVTVVERTTWLTAILFRSLSGKSAPDEISAYVGIVPCVRDWGSARIS